jgi:hypothetical protein
VRPVALLAALGCRADDPPDASGGQSGTEMPEGCVERDRVPVADPSQPIGDLPFSVDEADDLLRDRWVGELDPPADGQSAVDLVLVLDHEAAEWVSRDGPTGLGCVSTYEIPGTVDIEVGTAVSAAMSVVMSVSGPTTGATQAQLAAEEVGGTLEHGFDPVEWPEVYLTAALSFDLGAGRLDLGWLAESAPPDVTGASAPVAASVEPIGSASLARP